MSYIYNLYHVYVYIILIQFDACIRNICLNMLGKYIPNMYTMEDEHVKSLLIWCYGYEHQCFEQKVA